MDIVLCSDCFQDPGLRMDAEGFGACTVTGSCEAACPKQISLNFIARMNREHLGAWARGKK